MLLAIDIGNTNLVIAVHTGEKWLPEWRTETSLTKSVSDYERFLRTCFLESGVSRRDVDRAVLSSVVPALNGVLMEAARHFLGLDALLIRPAIYPQLPIKVQNPSQIGTDLVANAVAGYQLAQQTEAPHPVIVADFGTALTFTVVDKTGQILGVSIAPGLRTAIHALSLNTAQLPVVPLEMPASAIGTDTVTALQAGVLKGYVGLVSYMLEEIESELREDCLTIATGGLSAILTPLAPHFDLVDKQLTLNGLKAIAEWVSD